MEYLTATIRKKLMFAFTAMALLIAGTGVTGVWFTSAVGDQGEHLGAGLGPLVEAAMLVQLRSTEARLKFEEINTQRERDLRRKAEGNTATKADGSVDTGASDVQVGLIEVWALLDETLLYVDAVLNGGETLEGKFLATTSPLVREKMEQIRAEINDLKSTGREQYVENASIDEAAVEKFQAAFDDFLWLSDEAEDAMKDELVAGLEATRTYTKTSNYLMGAISIIGIALGTMLGWGFGRSIANPLTQMTTIT